VPEKFEELFTKVSVGWLGWLAGCLAGCLVCLAAWLAGWLAGLLL